MPLLGSKVQCYQCMKEESFMWHQTSKGVQCNDCHETEHSATKVQEEEEKKPVTPAEKPKASANKKGSKGTRNYKTRQNPNALPKQYSTKGKGRRVVFKKKEPVKLTAAGATFRTSTSILHKGTVWTVGDIVSCRDRDGDIYYAIVTGFLTDMYCEKSASITWLLPVEDDLLFRRTGFDPMRFVLGPADNRPRRLDCFEFVMHCPHDYYRQNTPFPDGLPEEKKAGYVWGRMQAENSCIWLPSM